MANFVVELKVVSQMAEGQETTHTKRTVSDVADFLRGVLSRFENQGTGVPEVQFLTVRKVPEKVIRAPKPEVRK